MSNRTSDFQSIVEAHPKHRPRSPTDTKGLRHRRPLSGSDRPGAPTPTSKAETGDQHFLQEAHRLLDHITQLHYFLIRARKYYLDTSSRHVSLSTTSPNTHSPLSGSSDVPGAQDPYAHRTDTLPILRMLSLLRNMSDAQRGEMDHQTQVLVEGFLRRAETLASMAETLSNKSKLAAAPSLLGFLMSDEDVHGKVLQEHRQSVVWLVRKRLMDVSLVQKDMQEKLLQRKATRNEDQFYKGVQVPNAGLRQRTGNTPSGSLRSAPATRRPSAIDFSGANKPVSDSTYNLSLSKLTSTLAASLTGSSHNTPLSSRLRLNVTGPPPPSTHHFSTPDTSLESSGLRTTSSLSVRHSDMDGDTTMTSEDEDVAMNLSAQERQLLESENAALLEELESNIEQVRETTQSLQTISNLQSRLSHELQQQSETIDLLYDDAWRSTDRVKSANVQLVKAQRNLGDARIWILVFLVMASAILLFLDYYG
ncbi:hypothetical protein DFS34DRAFT_109512 [Phlyctochytrium arcticum]|nr:hypothetical protein DFS34DRAFT_109512 [Phlyctochytrium arcticum]